VIQLLLLVLLMVEAIGRGLCGSAGAWLLLRLLEVAMVDALVVAQAVQ